ncbi:MAG: hypothetical protein EZS28_035451, partial [Streblomastix strix]
MLSIAQNLRLSAFINQSINSTCKISSSIAQSFVYNIRSC